MKISFNEATYITGWHKRKHRFEKYFCNWDIKKENDNSAYINCTMKLYFYILIFIPVHIIKVLLVLWDGGLKEFTIEPRNVLHSNIVGWIKDSEESEFGRFMVVWNKRSNICEEK